MKINGTEVKGIKKAIGEWNKLDNRKYITIIYDRKNKEVNAVSWIWYKENCNERLSDGYFRYENIIDLIRDAYYDDYKVTMITVQTVLREYVI